MSDRPSKLIGQPAPPPFDGYLVYGPILHKTERRRMVSLVPIKGNKSLRRTSMSFARYLMSVHLGRRLDRSEQVDHVDNNKLNDDVKNLQILTGTENTRKAVRDNKITKNTVLMKCPECRREFARSRRVTHLLKCRGTRCTCCSPSCSRKFTVRSKKENVTQQIQDNVIREYEEPSAI